MKAELDIKPFLKAINEFRTEEQQPCGVQVVEGVGLVAKLLSILHRTAVAADVAVTQIVSQKKDDVRTGGGAQGGGREEDKR